MTQMLLLARTVVEMGFHSQLPRQGAEGVKGARFLQTPPQRILDGTHKAYTPLFVLLRAGRCWSGLRKSAPCRSKESLVSPGARGVCCL